MNKAHTLGHKAGSVAHKSITTARNVVVGASVVTTQTAKTGVSVTRDFFNGFASAFKRQQSLILIENKD